jgi:hypothetical protein
MDYIPIAIFWGLALIGLFGKRSILIYLFFATMPFGSFAAIPPGLTAGLTLTPTPIIAALLFGRTFMDAKAVRFAVSALCAPRGLLLLTLFWVVAVAVTLLMPRVFADVVMVTPMKMTGLFHTEALVPTKQNLSQIAYLTISIFTVITFARLMLETRYQQIALKALCLGAAITVATGILDMLSHYLPLTPLLEPFRTAKYALMVDVKVAGGVQRVVGLMPEASAFGSLSIQLLVMLYFLRHAITDDFLRRRLVPVVGGLLLVFTWLSTSSSAYVALVVFGASVFLEWLWRGKTARKGTRKGQELELEFWVAFVAAAALFTIYIVRPETFDPAVKLFDQMVLKKTHSSSFEERSFWNQISWEALLSTFGLGVGMGGTRASNEIIAVVSNTGFLGAFFYYAFVLQSLLRRAYPGDAVNTALVSGLRWGFLPGMTSGFLAGTSADFGVENAFLFGTLFAAATISWHNHRTSQSVVDRTAPSQEVTAA